MADRHHCYLADEAQVAIFDATNSTEERREKLVSSSAAKAQLMPVAIEVHDNCCHNGNFAELRCALTPVQSEFACCIAAYIGLPAPNSCTEACLGLPAQNC